MWPWTSWYSSWFEKRQRNQRSNCQHLLDHGKSKRVPEKNIYFCSIDYAKAFDWVDHNKLWKILQDMEIPDHLTCLLRNMYVGHEATVRTERGTTDWFQIGKGVHQACILSPCLFNLYADCCCCCCITSVVCDSVQPHRQQPTRFPRPWDSPGKNTRMGCHFLLQGVFPTQGWNPCFPRLLRWQADSSPLSHLGSPS